MFSNKRAAAMPSYVMCALIQTTICKLLSYVFEFSRYNTLLELEKKIYLVRQLGRSQKRDRVGVYFHPFRVRKQINDDYLNSFIYSNVLTFNERNKNKTNKLLL